MLRLSQIKINFRSYYNSLPQESVRRFAIIQSKLLLIQIFNFLLNLLPFYLWKREICRLFGIKLGEGANLCLGVRFLSIGKCVIGKRTVINRNCLIDNRDWLTIGNDVSIAVGTKIFTKGHNIYSSTFDLSGGPVVIGNHVCIFANVIVSPAVEILSGAVVYPGAVVTKSVSELSIVAGVPARVIGSRDFLPNYKIDSSFWFA